jgi:hypothetical protein
LALLLMLQLLPYKPPCIKHIKFVIYNKALQATDNNP